MKTKLPTPQKLPSGQYRCQVMVDGKRVSVVDEDPGRAQAKAVALAAGIAEDQAEPKTRISLTDAITRYIDDRRNVLSPSTIRGYDQIHRCHFQKLMKMRICDIDNMDLQRAINEEAGDKSYKTIKNAMSLVLAVLGQYKTVNTKSIRFPPHKKQEHAYLQGEEIVRLILACQGDIAEIPILMAIWLGMRRSEIVGLQWESVDFEQRKILVNHSTVFDQDGNIITKDYMKNSSSERTIDCPNYILERLKSIAPDKKEGPVFSMHPNTIYKNLKKICTANEIQFPGVHGLRHTNASVMLSLGIVDKIAMARGGWASKETMERVYQHIFQSDSQEADAVINAYFEEKLHTNLHTT